ncbi:MAG: prepilin-type N-terminal cleavage/methylation domain-containing protein [Clostridiales bacterium]|nr:prepilin-type N-terminal cleavage/methylation domain-containing protein [Clostridiales bacterium]
MRKSKRAITLVELIAALALMAIFLLACTSLIYPVLTVYNHMNEMNRSHILADTVVDSLRTECARTYISSKNDVWLSNGSGDAVMESFPGSSTLPSEVLVIRKNSEYCETLSTNYEITGPLCNSIYDAEDTDDVDPLTGNLTSRAVYKMFDTIPAEETAVASNKGHLHFGFFKVGSDSTSGAYPSELYDFTDPFMDPTYGDFTVELQFHDIKYGPAPSELPVYVLVDVKIYDGLENVYTRSNVVLSFASRVME